MSLFQEKIFCECVQKELHLIELEENFHFAKRLCGMYPYLCIYLYIIGFLYFSHICFRAPVYCIFVIFISEITIHLLYMYWCTCTSHFIKKRNHIVKPTNFNSFRILWQAWKAYEWLSFAFIFMPVMVRTWTS